MAELKSHFSDVLKQVANGDEVVISYGRNHRKVAVLVPYESYLPQGNKRQLGIFEAQGNYRITDDFELSDEELLQS